MVLPGQKFPKAGFLTMIANWVVYHLHIRVLAQTIDACPRSATGSESKCRSRGGNLCLAPLFRGDRTRNNIYGHFPLVLSYKRNYVYEVLVNR